MAEPMPCPTTTPLPGPSGRLGAEEAIDAVRNADVIVAAGTRLGQSTTFFDHRFIPADARIVHIEIDPKEIGRIYPIAVGVEGDVGAVVEEINGIIADGELLPDADWSSRVAAWNAARTARLAAEATLTGDYIKPQRVYAELRKVMPRGRHHRAGRRAGAQLRARPAELLPTPQPDNGAGPGRAGLQLPGFHWRQLRRSEPAGGQLHGDGGFLFNAQEFETAVRYGLKNISVVMNNDCWGSEKAYQKYAFNERYVGADTINPRFDRYAELFGGTGFYVERPEDIADVFQQALAVDGPSIIEIPTDPDEMPRPARLAEVQSP